MWVWLCLCPQSGPYSALRSLVVLPCVPGHRHEFFCLKYSIVCSSILNPVGNLVVLCSFASLMTFSSLFLSQSQLSPYCISQTPLIAWNINIPQTGSSNRGKELPYIMEMSKSSHHRPVCIKTVMMSSYILPLHFLFAEQKVQAHFWVWKPTKIYKSRAQNPTNPRACLKIPQPPTLGNSASKKSFF